MKVLYTSCHESLEYDEILLLSQLPGVEVRSCGAYVDPTQGCSSRPPIDMPKPPNEHIAASYRFNVEDHVLNDDLLDWCDCVVFMHMPEWIHKSLDVLDSHSGVPIVYRSIGQSSPSVETMLGNYKRHFGSRFRIVRYSPNEQFISGYAGSDGLIRFYKDSNEFCGWELPDKTERNVVHALQAAKSRGNFGHIEEALRVTEGLPRTLIGPHNEDLADQLCVANPPYEQYKYMWKSAGILFYTGMVPASYTLTFMEAAMTGVPIVSIGGEMWAKEHGWIDPQVLETPELVSSAFTVRSWEEAHDLIKEMRDNDDLLRGASAFNRAMALEKFDKINAANAWLAFLNGL